MEPAAVAELQVLLEGVALPSEHSSLVRYAQREGGSAEQIAMLRRLPERSYDNLDEVAEELVSVQPADDRVVPHSPHEESGAPPGGDAYTQLRPQSGAVRS
jgi:hypothetical protein